MNNQLSYCGLVDAKINASDQDLPVQSDDFHLDRPLYFACKSDRKSLCAPVKSGEGRVFECLLKNKEEPTMSEECRVQLQRRQKLAAENYKVSRGLGWFFLQN